MFSFYAPGILNKFHSAKLEVRMSSSNFLRQLPLNSSFDSLDPSSKPLDQKSYTKELQEFRESLLKSSSAWPQQLDTVASPLPVLIPRHLEEHIEKLGDCLVRAVTNIVERWWSDEKARLWERMPILDHQEAVLRWIEGPGKHIVEPFATRRGAWRPDFLLNFQEKDFPKKPVSSAIQICEINARFAFNGFWITAYAHEAYQAKSSRNPHLESPVDPAKVRCSLSLNLKLQTASFCQRIVPLLTSALLHSDICGIQGTC